MDTESLYAQLTDVFHEIFMREDFTLTAPMTAKDIEGWDSFKQIEIILAVEEKFKIKFSSKDLDRLDRVGDLASAIFTKIGV